MNLATRTMMGAASAALLVTPILAQERQRLPRDCRQEIVKLCGTDRGEMRSCLRDKRAQLSDTCSAALIERFRDRRDDSVTANRSGTRGEEFAYGTEPLQKADFWRAANDRAPLVLFVHGGGWKRGDKRMMQGSAKLSHWQSQGYAVASVNYRLVPDATVEQQAADVAASIAWFRENAARLGIDPGKIVIAGHSAGAHLVSLVGTDPSYLAAAGLRPDAIRGVVALDGAGYLVSDQKGENTRLLGDTYIQAFGTDPQRQDALSPTLHAAAPNAPAFLILHVDRADSTRQSKALAEALRSAGTSASVERVAGQGMRGHMEINRKLGEPGYPATALVDDFLRSVLN